MIFLEGVHQVLPVEDHPFGRTLAPGKHPDFHQFLRGQDGVFGPGKCPDNNIPDPFVPKKSICDELLNALELVVGQSYLSAMDNFLQQHNQELEVLQTDFRLFLLIHQTMVPSYKLNAINYLVDQYPNALVCHVLALGDQVG